MSVRDIGKIALMAAMVLLAAAVFGWMSDRQRTEETEIVRNAVRDAAVTCYAVEGAYPEDVEYLREHYQLAYDESRYFITYDAFASNRIPDIWVTERGAAG